MTENISCLSALFVPLVVRKGGRYLRGHCISCRWRSLCCYGAIFALLLYHFSLSLWPRLSCKLRVNVRSLVYSLSTYHLLLCRFCISIPYNCALFCGDNIRFCPEEVGFQLNDTTWYVVPELKHTTCWNEFMVANSKVKSQCEEVVFQSFCVWD